MRAPAWPFLPLLAACGQGLSNDYCMEGPGYLYPLEEGAWWRHDELVHVPNDEVLKCKRVVIGELQPIPLRPTVMAWPAMSMSYEADPVAPAGRLGRRWQEVRDGSVYRHVDEWFSGEEVTSDRDEVELYCPIAARAMDCPGAWEGKPCDLADRGWACAGVEWESSQFKLKVTAEDKTDPALWEACLAVEVDPDTCQVLGEPPAGCTYELQQEHEQWRVDAIDEGLEVPAGSFTTLRQSHRTRDEGDSEWGNWDTYNWARGVGKIREYQTEGEDEVLLDWCLPSDGATCVPPTLDELKAACTVSL